MRVITVTTAAFTAVTMNTVIVDGTKLPIYPAQTMALPMP